MKSLLYMTLSFLIQNLRKGQFNTKFQNVRHTRFFQCKALTCLIYDTAFEKWYNRLFANSRKSPFLRGI